MNHSKATLFLYFQRDIDTIYTEIVRFYFPFVNVRMVELGIANASLQFKCQIQVTSKNLWIPCYKKKQRSIHDNVITCIYMCCIGIILNRIVYSFLKNITIVIINTLNLMIFFTTSHPVKYSMISFLSIFVNLYKIRALYT